MNVTLILYESKYGTGKTIANTICPVLGPAKSFDINEAPQDIKYYSNIVFIFSLYGSNSGEKIISYIRDNQLDLSKKRVALVCVGLNKEDGLKEIKKMKEIINKKDKYCVDLKILNIIFENKNKIQIVKYNKYFSNLINKNFKNIYLNKKINLEKIYKNIINKIII